MSRRRGEPFLRRKNKVFFSSPAEARKYGLVDGGNNITASVNTQTVRLRDSGTNVFLVTGQLKIPIQASQTVFQTCTRAMTKFLILKFGGEPPFRCDITFNLRKFIYI